MSVRRLLAAFARRTRDRRSDLFGGLTIALVALAFVSPSLKDGFSFGGFDFDTTLTPLGQGVYSVVHAVTNGDAVSQMVAWNALSWRLVHSGHFPLWNAYSGLGMPQFLNFESAVLSLPDLVSYLFPLRSAFLVVVIMKLLLAGLGAYYFARVLRCRPLAATLGGAGFMLAGAFAGWLTWPLSDVLAWSGWICGFGLAAIRSSGRMRHVVGLTVAVMFSIYGGFPEANILFGIALGALVVMSLLVALGRQIRVPLRGVVRACVGCVAGVLCAAPLWLPGLQVISMSHRETEGHYVGLPTKTIALLLSQGYFGLPTGPAPQFQLRLWNYYETVSYVGAIAIVLVVVALGTAIRRPIVAGLAFALALSIALTYQPVAFHPLQHLLNALPVLDKVRFERMRSVTAFLIAVLAAIGLEQFLRAPTNQAVRRSLVAGTLLVAAWTAYLDVDSALSPSLRQQRFGTLVWPNIVVLLLMATVALTSSRGTTRTSSALRGAPPLLVAVEIAFLFFAGVGIPSYSKAFFEVTPPIAELQRITAGSLVGLNGTNPNNVRTFTGVGFYPNVNIGYSVRLFAIHDPLVPSAYYTSWPDQAAAPNKGGVGLFVPDIDSVALARRYGVAYLLTASGSTPPAGTEKVASIAGETLSKVPGAAPFSFGTAGDRVLGWTTNGDGAWAIRTEGSVRASLVLRVTDLPGLHATIDGRPLGLQSYDDVMLRATVPSGRHTIVLTYLPRRLELGVLLALITALALLVATVAARGLRKRRSLLS